MEVTQVSRMLLLTCVLFLTAHAQKLMNQNEQKVGTKSCSTLRTELTDSFLRSYENRVPASFLNQLLPRWLDYSLPNECHTDPNGVTTFNPSSTQDNGGPLGTLGDSGTIYTMSTHTRTKREVEEEESNVQVQMGVGRDRRSAEDDATSDNMATVDEGVALSREKRFLGLGLNGLPGLGGGMTGGLTGGPGRGPAKEISESAQMMNNLLMLSRFQKARAMREYSTASSSKTGFIGERPSFGNGMYGDPYPGRKRREAVTTEEENMVDVGAGEGYDTKLSRQKRFFLFPTEPGEPNTGPTMFDMMLGTARDPNTGKKMEFGGDYMKNMWSRSLATITGTPAGKEPSDFVKNTVPLMFLNMRRRPDMVSNYRQDYDGYPRTTGYTQRRNRDGFYGDAMPRRGKRSVEEDADASANADTNDHHRSKRATTENQAITVGDVSIPLEYFKPRDLTDDVKDTRSRVHHQHNYYQQHTPTYTPPQTYHQPYRHQQPPPQPRYTPHQLQVLYAKLEKYFFAKFMAAQQSNLISPLPPTNTFVPPPAFPPQNPPMMPPFNPPPQEPTYTYPAPTQNNQYAPVPNAFLPPPPPQNFSPFIPNPPGPSKSGGPPAGRKKRSTDDVASDNNVDESNLLNRQKRSDNKDSNGGGGFFGTGSFFSPLLSFYPRTQYVRPRYSPFSNKVGYVDHKGGRVYGDRLPGHPVGGATFAAAPPFAKG